MGNVKCIAFCKLKNPQRFYENLGVPLETLPLNAEVFARSITVRQKKFLERPKRKLPVTTHFSEITKQQ